MTKQSKHPFVEAFAANPLLIDPQAIDLVNSTINHLAADATFLGMVNQTQMSVMDGDYWGNDQDPYRPYVVSNGVLQIPIQGMLLNRLSYQFGRWATGYKYIEKAMSRGLADANVKAIALVIDSPGGEVAGCFELAEKIFEGRSQKPIRAFAADSAYSAAFALASAATDISVTSSGGTGSVGVVTLHVDYSEMLANDGIKVTFIFAGAHKVDGNAYEKLPDGVKSRIQERINKTYGLFTGMVARNRGLEDKAVRATEALTYDATDSVAKGFADRIGALDEEMVIFTGEVTATEDEQMTTFTQEQMDAAVASATAAGAAQGETTERARFTAITGSDIGKARPKAAMAAYEAGLNAEQAAAMLGKLPEEKAEEAKAPVVVETAQTGTTAFDAAMLNTLNPNVGANVVENGQTLSVSDGIFASVGLPPVQKRN